MRLLSSRIEMIFSYHWIFPMHLSKHRTADESVHSCRTATQRGHGLCSATATAYFIVLSMSILLPMHELSTATTREWVIYHIHKSIFFCLYCLASLVEILLRWFAVLGLEVVEAWKMITSTPIWRTYMNKYICQRHRLNPLVFCHSSVINQEQTGLNLA